MFKKWALPGNAQAQYLKNGQSPSPLGPKNSLPDPTLIGSGIGRYIGMADMGNAYRYWLSVSADKKAHIGNLANIIK